MTTVLQFYFSHAVHLSMIAGVPGVEVWMHGGNVNESEHADYVEVMETVPENVFFGHADNPDLVCDNSHDSNPDILITNNRGTTIKRGPFTVYTTEAKLANDPPPTGAYRLIRKGIDTDEFAGWHGDPMSDVVMTVNNIMNRPRAGNQDLHQALLDSSLPYCAYGRYNPAGFLSRTPYKQMLREAGVYAHLSNTISPNGLYEAMSVGLPVVTIPGYANTDAITHGYNGLVAATTDQFIDSIERLRTDYELAERLGRNARRTVHGRYHHAEFANRWRTVIDTLT